jgi:aminoglycoside phosphotransferase (APT) family kinase protein
MSSLTLPPGVRRWLRAARLSVDSEATSRIASSRNLTLVARRGGVLSLVKIAATVDDPFSAREIRLLGALDGGGAGFWTPRVTHAATGRFAIEWLPGVTAFDRRRRDRRVAVRDDAAIGHALAHLHARSTLTTEAVSGDLIARLLWLSPAEYASSSAASLTLWNAVQTNSRAELALRRLLTFEDAHPRVLCHGDLRQSNVLLHAGRVGFVDLELGGAGDPARDLGMWMAEDLGFFLVPRDRREQLTLTQLRVRLRAFLRAWEREAAVLKLPGRGGVRPRAMAWAAEALLRRTYTMTFHDGHWTEREAHVTASALELLVAPGKWARHFLGTP